MSNAIEKLILAASKLRDESEVLARRLENDGIADCVYNPLMYAWQLHEAYIRLAGGSGAKTILLGMNPGPHGMGQMGIPFAATSVVRNLLKISDIEVGQPARKHQNRKVNGLMHPKEEVSGTRLWGVLSQRYGAASEIFRNVFVLNHCPLMIFSGARGTNITPNNISGNVVDELLATCDEHLRQVVTSLGANKVIGVGKYAESRAIKALSGTQNTILSCWHPSPASPLANRNGGADWRENILAVLP
ncbi:MAG: single-stranded DNA-binding protein [Euryarchaeota archaeon]|nr:single-stranded DNA-binding protein [Euryarchaeota archaeon]|tara:strand:- start:1163 stop:1900 length:738 start_codon:yes stop_codon:yes gene_type:complete